MFSDFFGGQVQDIPNLEVNLHLHLLDEEPKFCQTSIWFNSDKVKGNGQEMKVNPISSILHKPSGPASSNARYQHDVRTLNSDFVCLTNLNLKKHGYHIYHSRLYNSHKPHKMPNALPHPSSLLMCKGRPARGEISWDGC